MFGVSPIHPSLFSLPSVFPHPPLILCLTLSIPASWFYMHVRIFVICKFFFLHGVRDLAFESVHICLYCCAAFILFQFNINTREPSNVPTFKGEL